jgi:hypothetical protein
MDDRVETQSETGPSGLPAGYAARVIRHRCSDVISEAELACVLCQPESDTARMSMVLPAEIGECILDVLAAVDQRIAGIEAHLLRREAEGVA